MAHTGACFRNKTPQHFYACTHYVCGSAHEAEYFCRWYNEDMLLDPYAPLISGRRCFGVRDEIEEFEEKVCAI